MAGSDSTQPDIERLYSARDVADMARSQLDELIALFCAIRELTEEDTMARSLAGVGWTLADRSAVALDRVAERLGAA